MKTFIKTTLAAFALVAGASAGQAETVWHFPYKGTPYATQTAPAAQAAPVKIVRHGKHIHKLIAGKTQVIR
jgi:hypothetical protein